jgi:hypothetical protein
VATLADLEGQDMRYSHEIDQWIGQFKGLERMSGEHLGLMRLGVHFPVLEAGAIAYRRIGIARTI